MSSEKITISLQTQAAEELPITISVDGKVIFNELVKRPSIMPPIVFSEEFPFSEGVHELECMDSRRGSKLTHAFTIPKDRSLHIFIGDDPKDMRCDVSQEEMSFK